MTFPSTPHPLSPRRGHASGTVKLHAVRLGAYLAIVIVVCLWCSAHFHLQKVAHQETTFKTLSVGNSSSRRRKSSTRKSSLHSTTKGLPRWKLIDHVSADITPVGAFRYKDTSACITKPCGLFLPAVDLKTLVVPDEAMNLLQPQHAKQQRSSLYYTNNLPSYPNHALLTRCGLKSSGGGPKANQDRALLLSPFYYSSTEHADLVLGLFDGHGMVGHEVSHHAAMQLPSILSRHLEKQSPADALTHTFQELHKTIPSAAAASSGSTGIVVLKLQNALYVANTGDSLAMLVSCNSRGGEVEIVYQTKPHKPNVPQERARIEAAGGTVMDPPMQGETSRVIIPMPGGMVVGLAMSRSIGDGEGAAVGVICDPTVDALDLSTLTPLKNLFVVAASDGLFDHVPIEEVATRLARSLYNSENAQSPLETSEELIMKSSKGWIANGMPYRDDITVATAKLIRE